MKASELMYLIKQKVIEHGDCNIKIQRNWEYRETYNFEIVFIEELSGDKGFVIFDAFE